MNKEMENQKEAIIIGAGPAGLTAAYELLERTDIKPIVVEKSEYIGGISKTVNYKGNRMDLGGHRFFSKHDRVMEWWLRLFPLQRMLDVEIPRESRQRLSNPGQHLDPEHEDRVMLLRSRKSRIYFLQKFFDYPISLSMGTLVKLGPKKTMKILFSYLRSSLFPIRNEQNLEQFFTNRFGRNLYLTFFKSYTEKLWGVPCSEISADWGAQRVKGLSVAKTIKHAFGKIFRRDRDITQKDTETSLIEQFLYPKYGPGQMWEEVARRIREKGGEVLTHFEVDRIYTDGNSIKEVQAINKQSGARKVFEGSYFFSTMPVKELIRAIQAEVPTGIADIGEGLVYRDFIVVGLLVDKLRISDGKEQVGGLIKDNWVYIQEPDVSVGRMQIFNNWSPYLVADSTTAWLGLEYFCFENDELWRKTDSELIDLASEELEKMDLISRADVLDGTVVRVPKAYPAYFGTYDRIGEIRDYFQRFENLFLIGRNGMHRYNNMDHAMLTAMTAVDNIIEGRRDKSNIWAVNVEEEYLETV